MRNIEHGRINERYTMITPGMKVKVKGTVRYGRYLGFHRGSFPDIIFTVKGIYGDVIQLVAPGYGDCESGRGSVYIGSYKDKLEVV